MLLKKGVNVQAIVVRKLFNPQRFFSEFSRDGSRLIIKIWKKLFLRKNAYKNSSNDTIVNLMKDENITFKDVFEFQKLQHIPVLSCKDLNDAKVIELLKEQSPDLVVFTGGGLIRDEVLTNAGHGVVNCHMGNLPHYRGMDVVEWPILENKNEEVGVTVHFMNKGIDTGDILSNKRIDFTNECSIKRLREKFEPIMCQEIVNTSYDFLQGHIKPQKQQVGDGRQYFIMHRRLMEYTKSKVNKG